MAKLTVFTDKGVRSVVAKQYLDKLGVDYDERSLETDASAKVFLESNSRDGAHYPLPQFFVGDSIAWENGFHDVNGLTLEQINERVGELNA
jgi:glutaredoxin